MAQISKYEADRAAGKKAQPNSLRSPLYNAVRRYVYPFALKLIEKQRTYLAANHLQDSEEERVAACTGLFTKSMGLPCKHTISQRLAAILIGISTAKSTPKTSSSTVPCRFSNLSSLSPVAVGPRGLLQLSPHRRLLLMETIRLVAVVGREVGREEVGGLVELVELVGLVGLQEAIGGVVAMLVLRAILVISKQSPKTIPGMLLLLVAIRFLRYITFGAFS
ncbi:hypothetical protein E4U24_002005 [Claviceps purpurea]|nr:hypothetical protein E4U24_002005 [Claviceps purpurea]